MLPDDPPDIIGIREFPDPYDLPEDCAVGQDLVVHHRAVGAGPRHDPLETEPSQGIRHCEPPRHLTAVAWSRMQLTRCQCHLLPPWDCEWPAKERRAPVPAPRSGRAKTLSPSGCGTGD